VLHSFKLCIQNTVVNLCTLSILWPRFICLWLIWTVIYTTTETTYFLTTTMIFAKSEVLLFINLMVYIHTGIISYSVCNKMEHVYCSRFKMVCYFTVKWLSQSCILNSVVVGVCNPGVRVQIRTRVGSCFKHRFKKRWPQE